MTQHSTVSHDLLFTLDNIMNLFIIILNIAFSRVVSLEGCSFLFLRDLFSAREKGS